MSYQNMIMYSAVLPSYDPDKIKDKNKKAKGKSDGIRMDMSNKKNNANIRDLAAVFRDAKID